MTIISRRRERTAERLRPLEALCGTTPKELTRVDRLTYEFDADPGQTLISEGDSPRGFFLIVSGRAVVSVAGVECGVLEPGAFFGETAMLDHGPEPVTVTALTRMVLRVASRREFGELIEIPPIARTMLQTLAIRRRSALRDFTATSRSSPTDTKTPTTPVTAA